jgi:hypothetical protein
MKPSVGPLVVLLAGLTATSLQTAEDPLPAWNDGPAKASVLKFV